MWFLGFHQTEDFAILCSEEEKEEEEARIGMTRMHAMLSGLVVPFGKF